MSNSLKRLSQNFMSWRSAYVTRYCRNSNYSSNLMKSRTKIRHSPSKSSRKAKGIRVSKLNRWMPSCRQRRAWAMPPVQARLMDFQGSLRTSKRHKEQIQTQTHSSRQNLNLRRSEEYSKTTRSRARPLMTRHHLRTQSEVDPHSSRLRLHQWRPWIIRWHQGA